MNMRTRPMADPTDRAAQMLADLRRDRKLLAELPAEVRPETIAAGYRIQDRFRALWGQPVAGWKIGATAKPVQAKFGVEEPFAGPFFSPDVYASPGRPKSAHFPHHCLESEFAFRFGRAVAPRATRYTREEVAAAIDAVVPAFEIVGPRFDNLLFGKAATAIADCGVNAGMIFGQPMTNWRQFNLPGHAVRLTVNGTLKAEGSGANVLGDPMTVLEWAVNHLSARGIALEPGQIISTGTTTGIAYVEAGDTAVADFGPIGRVEVRFEGPAPVNQVRLSL
jgi:2-keto-4-pentenoate hydratase